MQLEEAKKNLNEIIESCEEDIKNYNEDIIVEFYLKDLVSLQTVLQALKKYKNMYQKEYNEHMEMKRQNGVLVNNELILKKSLDNSIPIQVVEEKIKEYERRKEGLNDIEASVRLDVKIRAYKELLKGK